MTNAKVDPERKLTLKYVVLGEYLPAFSRALLQDGQVYYLCVLLLPSRKISLIFLDKSVSVTSNIVVVILTWVKGAPIAYRLMFTVLNVALTNMMACRVYRHTKFGDFREDVLSTKWIASQIARFDDVEAAPEKMGPLHFSAAHDVHVDIHPLESASSEEDAHTHKNTTANVVELRRS